MLNKLFKKLPIKYKLVFVILTISLLSFFVSFSIFIVYDFYSFHSKLHKEITQLGELIGNNNAVFANMRGIIAKESAQQNLYNVLPSTAHIQYGSIFDQNKEIQAYYDRNFQDSSLLNSTPDNRSKNPQTEKSDNLLDLLQLDEFDGEIGGMYSTKLEMVLDSSDFKPVYKADIQENSKRTGLFFDYIHMFFIEGHMDVFHPIVDPDDENRILATVFLRSDLSPSYERYSQYLKIVSIIFLITFAVIYLLTLFVQKSISKPISELTNVTLKIAKNNDYSYRVQEEGKDEVALLANSFNEMIAKIETQNVELVKAKDRAESLANAKAQFLSNMTHEIRTPLNGVIGMTDILLGTKLDEKQQEFLGIVKFSAKNLMVIINDVLDISKINAGKMTFEQEVLDVNHLLKTIIAGNRGEADKKGLKVTLDVSDEIPKNLLGDSVRLSQIVLNLFTNAIKFTIHGGIVIGNKLIEKTEKEALVRFYVKDSGVGIARENFDLVFSEFSQERGDTTRKFGGTGLGLSICKKLVEMQGGKMFLESQLGNGSTFSFELKFKINQEEEITSLKTPEESLHNGISQENNQKVVLLAEDNEVNQMVVEELLGQWQFNVEIAENGQEAVDMLTEKHYDLILMDVHMPELDGYGATKMIREEMSSPKKDIPIIAMTAAAMDGESDKCLAAGMNDYISKPFDKNILYEKIVRLIVNNESTKKAEN
ncbi:response regulator [Flexithrix dorotheae]|uniref:response regulator n=1 Tax=Flexithrix dorotheae TaxID=70993 RepID=UPI00036ECDEC|nr:response regulator [Flexithrix dorotheae]